MQIGVVFPQTEFISDAAAVRAYAEAADGLGCRHIAVDTTRSALRGLDEHIAGLTPAAAVLGVGS
jgi:hypothetical protein